MPVWAVTAGPVCGAASAKTWDGSLGTWEWRVVRAFTAGRIGEGERRFVPSGLRFRAPVVQEREVGRSHLKRNAWVTRMRSIMLVKLLKGIKQF